MCIIFTNTSESTKDIAIMIFFTETGTTGLEREEERKRGIPRVWETVISIHLLGKKMFGV